MTDEPTGCQLITDGEKTCACADCPCKCLQCPCGDRARERAALAAKFQLREFG